MAEATLSTVVSPFVSSSFWNTVNTTENALDRIIKETENHLSRQGGRRLVIQTNSVRNRCIESFGEKARKRKVEENSETKEKRKELESETATFIVNDYIGRVSEEIRDLPLTEEEHNQSLKTLEELHKIGESAELGFRRLQLRHPSSEENFRTTLYWMAERGGEEDLDLLKELRATPPYAKPDLQTLLEIAIQEIQQRVNDPDYVMEKEEAAYQAHQTEWKEQYKNQFIAIHRGTVIDSDSDKPALIDRLMKKQKEEGPFRAYIVHIGESEFTVRGPKSKRAGQPQENTEE